MPEQTELFSVTVTATVECNAISKTRRAFRDLHLPVRQPGRHWKVVSRRALNRQCAHRPGLVPISRPLSIDSIPMALAQHRFADRELLSFESLLLVSGLWRTKSESGDRLGSGRPCRSEYADQGSRPDLHGTNTMLLETISIILATKWLPHRNAP